MTHQLFLRWAAIPLACAILARDLTLPVRAASRSPREESPEGSELRCSTALASIPTNGYLKYRTAPNLEREACRAPVAGERLRGRLKRAVVLAAQEQLNLPLGYGRYFEVAGETYLFCLEPHYHPPGGGVSPEGWHKGVTVYRGTPRA